MKSYIFPPNISKVICSDLDETFMPFSEIEKANSGINELEKFLSENIVDQSMIFGLITGSNLTATLRKINGYANYYPHFIASSLGTEFHWVRNNEIIESEKWVQLIEDSGFKKENISTVLHILSNQGIELISEPEDYQGKYKATLYYHIQNNMEHDFNFIRQTALDFHMKVLFNKCNPATGDPENSYDIEFLPLCCGKGEVIDFLKKELNLSSDSFYCFGDSFNDFSMFAQTKHAYLVANADPEAIKNHPHVLEKNIVGVSKKKCKNL
ncbi:MAG: HAD-IIB family hydrolase [Bacteroides sp.]|nr:HAD-IIB family hydrolase [Bacteroides sp.]